MTRPALIFPDPAAVDIELVEADDRRTFDPLTARLTAEELGELARIIGLDERPSAERSRLERVATRVGRGEDIAAATAAVHAEDGLGQRRTTARARSTRRPGSGARR